MAYFDLPVRSDLPAYEFQSTLEGVVYTFAFHYNARLDTWFMDILDEVGNPLIMGTALLAQVFLIDRFTAAGGPPGTLLLIDSQDGQEDPGINDLGTRFTLVYRESTTPDGE